MKKYLSPVAANLKPSGIRKYFDMASMIEDVISLGVGEPDFATPWIMRESAIFRLNRVKQCIPAMPA